MKEEKRKRRGRRKGRVGGWRRRRRGLRRRGTGLTAPTVSYVVQGKSGCGSRKGEVHSEKGVHQAEYMLQGGSFKTEKANLIRIVTAKTANVKQVGQIDKGESNTGTARPQEGQRRKGEEKNQ